MKTYKSSKTGPQIDNSVDIADNAMAESILARGEVVELKQYIESEILASEAMIQELIGLIGDGTGTLITVSE